jgi:DNA polymerase III subunit beta
MKIICTQENLKSGLQTVSRIISGSNTLPILNNILLKTEDGLLKLVATNLEIAISTTVRCKIEAEGSLSVPAKTLADLVSNLPNVNVTLEDQGAEVLLSTDHYRTKIKTLPSEEFPPIPLVEQGTKLSMEAAELKAALDQVIFAASPSESQPEISGIYVKYMADAIKLVATDRYRLAERTLPYKNNGPAKGVIVPQKTAAELSRILAGAGETVDIILTENQISLNAGDTLVISRLIDGQYPEYQNIIPEQFNATISVSKSAFASAMKTSGIFSRTTSHDVGESTVELEAEITGEAGNIILNYRYVLEALNTMAGDTLLIKIVNEDAPVIFLPQGDGNYIYLVMPIKG